MHLDLYTFTYKHTRYIFLHCESHLSSGCSIQQKQEIRFRKNRTFEKLATQCSTKTLSPWAYHHDGHYHHHHHTHHHHSCRHATLCYAMLCYAVLCCAVACYAMLCYAVVCYFYIIEAGEEEAIQLGR